MAKRKKRRKGKTMIYKKKKIQTIDFFNSNVKGAGVYIMVQHPGL
jgi:hypothetical protein